MRRHFPIEEQTGEHAHRRGHPDFPPLGVNTAFIGLHLTQLYRSWQTLAQVNRDLSEYLRGWVGYFCIQEFCQVFKELDGFIRSRLRSMQLKKWKKPKKFQRMMILAGYPVEEAKRTWVKMNKWPSVARRPVRFVLNLDGFRRRGLLFLDDFTQRNLKLELGR